MSPQSSGPSARLPAHQSRTPCLSSLLSFRHSQRRSSEPLRIPISTRPQPFLLLPSPSRRPDHRALQLPSAPPSFSQREVSRTAPDTHLYPPATVPAPSSAIPTARSPGLAASLLSFRHSQRRVSVTTAFHTPVPPGPPHSIPPSSCSSLACGPRRPLAGAARPNAAERCRPLPNTASVIAPPQLPHPVRFSESLLPEAEHPLATPACNPAPQPAAPC